MIHSSEHPQAGDTVTVSPVSAHQNLVDGAELVIEDWWDRINGVSWMDSVGNWAALNYATRSIGLPIDNEVVYGKIAGLGYLVHVSEIVND